MVWIGPGVASSHLSDVPAWMGTWQVVWGCPLTGLKWPFDHSLKAYFSLSNLNSFSQCPCKEVKGIHKFTA